jgi:hypothetical protein
MVANISVVATVSSTYHRGKVEPKMIRHRKNRRRRGVSRIGVIVVLIIVALLIALLVPAVTHVREAQALTQCTNNLKQIGLGLHNFETTFKRLPPLYGGHCPDLCTASSKFPYVWGSTHVFILSYLEADINSGTMRSGQPSDALPSLALFKKTDTYICPADPSVLVSGEIGGASYAANAQVFAPLQDETLTGKGDMYDMSHANFCDRGSSIAGIKDGASNTIAFTHSYGLCGSQNTGTFWLYSTGYRQPPETFLTFQPWSRATYIGQKGMTGPGERPFQVRPLPYDRLHNSHDGLGCDPLLPASPHPNGMLVLVLDAAVRTVSPNISVANWNKACLPNDGSMDLPQDWAE